MRILMTTDTVGGVWGYALQLARALAPHGVEIALATTGGPVSPAQRRQLARVPNVTPFESSYKLEWMHDPWDDVRRTDDWLQRIERDFRPDVIHLNAMAYAADAFAAPVLTVGHSCVLSWFEAVRGHPAPAEWDRYRAEVWRGLRAAGRVVAPSQAMLTALQKHYGPLHRARVIYNGRDAADYTATGVGDVGKPLIVAVGRLWDEAKNIAALARVAADVPWPIAVAGDASGPDGGQATTDGVRHLGLLDDRSVAALLAEASIYALPARYEPFGLSILEAALSRCALVLGDIPSLREIWGDSAVFVPPDDADALRDALMRLIQSPERRHAMAAKAEARAARYTVAAKGRAYRTTYEALLGGSEAVRPDSGGGAGALARGNGAICES